MMRELVIHHGPLSFFTSINNLYKNPKKENNSMSGHQREWDENRSPQWKYLLRNESQARRELQKALEKDGEGEIKANRKSRKKKEKEANTRRGSRGTTKAGKKIVYTASPGNREDSRWTNKQFLGNVEERKKILSAPDEGSTDA